MPTTFSKRFRHECKRFVVWMLSLVCFGAMYPAAAQDVKFGFAVGIGGPPSGIDFAWDMTVDGSGSVHAIGRFSGTVDFDPGPGTVELTSAGNRDVFVCKLDTLGNLIWARAISGPEIADGHGVAVDEMGNVYITGWFEGEYDFDPGPGTANLTSTNDGNAQSIFVSKLDSAGNYVWARAMVGSGGAQGRGIALDALGNVYTTGSFRRTVDFDPGEGTANLSTPGNAASVDIFVSKLDSAGNYVWAGRMGGTDGEEGLDIAVDGAGNVYTTGVFRDTVDFDPGPGTFNLDPGPLFISKLNSAGDFVWAKATGGFISRSIAVDQSGNVYTTGGFNDTVDFDPGPGIANLSTAGLEGIFVSKLDSAGDYVWARAMGGTTDNAEGWAIAVDPWDNGNVYTTGGFRGTVDFDPGVETLEFTSMEPGDDLFIQKLDFAGNLVWVQTVSGNHNVVGLGIGVDYSGNVYTAGTFQGTADFDPGEGTAILTSGFGEEDIFVHKLLVDDPQLPAAGRGAMGLLTLILLCTSSAIILHRGSLNRKMR